MKKRYFITFLLFTAVACSSRDQAESKNNVPPVRQAAFDQKEANFNSKVSDEEVMSSSAARPGMADSVHKFIRTANLKFRTENVVNSSFAIEDLVAEQGGYIENSSIDSRIDEEQYVKCSRDSAWKVTKFVLINQLTARVPVAKLDQTLKALRPFAVYLDYRKVNAENIAFDMYLNSLVQQRVTSHAGKQEQFSQKDQAATADQLLQRQMQSDASLVENMRMMDKVQYSTIQIYMYQNPQVRMDKVPVFTDLKAYDSGFGMQLKQSLYEGWLVVEFLFLVIIKGWSLLLIAFLTVFLIRRRRKMQRKQS